MPCSGEACLPIRVRVRVRVRVITLTLILPNPNPEIETEPEPEPNAHPRHNDILRCWVRDVHYLSHKVRVSYYF